jgi:hypothetical protein
LLVAFGGFETDSRVVLGMRENSFEEESEGECEENSLNVVLKIV